MGRINYSRIKATKVRGSSLIEVITAMIIIGIVFAASAVIYLNVISTSFLTIKSVATLHIQEVMIKTELEKKYERGDFQFEDMKVFQEVTPTDLPEVKLITWEARDESGKVLVIKKKLKYVNP